MSKAHLALSSLIFLVGCTSAFERGYLHQQNGEHERARVAYQDAGAQAGALYNLAILEEAGDPALAQQHYREALALDSRLVGAWVNGVRLWLQRGEADSARVWAEQACQLLPDHPEPFVSRALLALADRDDDAGRADLARALEREPEHVSALALLLTLTSDPEQREALAGRLSNSAARRPGSELLASRALRAVGQGGQALPLLRHAVLSQPEDASLLLELGLCLAHLGYDREAMRALWRAEAAGADDTRLTQTLAELYQRETERLRQP